MVTPASYYTQRSLTRATPTSCRAEVDQQQLLCSAKLVGHGADHVPPRRRHGHPDSGVGVIAAVDLQKDCGDADMGQVSSGKVRSRTTSSRGRAPHIYLLSS